MNITRKLHVFLLIPLILTACSLHRTARQEASAQLTAHSHFTRRDSLATGLVREWQEARTLRLTGFALSPPDSLGRQHLTHVVLAQSQATASDSLALHRRHTASTDASRHTAASTTASAMHDTRADSLRMPGWEWLVAAIVVVLIAMRIHRRK